MKLRLGSQEGSTGFAALVGLISLSMSAMYVFNQTKASKNSVDQAKLSSMSAESRASSLNSLSIYKSLLGDRQVSADVYEPGLYPINYFDLDWNLARNSRITDSYIQDVKLNVASLKAFPSDRKLDRSTAEIFSGAKSSLEHPTATNYVRFLRANLAAGKSKLIDTVDVEVTSDIVRNGVKTQQKMQARIPVPVPKAIDPVIEFSPVGANAWVSNPTNLSGPTDIRVLGSGVIAYARLMVGAAGPFMLGGFDETTGVVKHKATNALARNVEIGRMTHNFGAGTTSSIDYKILDPKESCRAVPIINGSAVSVDVVITAELISVADDVSEKGKTDKKVTVSTTVSGADPRNLAFEQVNAMCEDKCKYINPDEAGDEGASYLKKIFKIRSDQVADRKFEDFSWGYMRTIREETGVLDAKICEDYSAVYKAVSHSLGRPAMNGDAFIDHYDAIEYTYYQEPACQKKFLFTRTSCGCFEENTQITLGDGISTKSIELLTENDKVWNPKLKRAQPILRMTRGPESFPMFKISTKHSSVSVTRGHPFPIEDGSIHKARDLKVGQTIQVNGQWQKIASIETVTSETLPVVWNLELGEADDADGHFLLANGIVTGDLKIQEEMDSAEK